MSNYPKFQIPGVVAASGEYTIPPLTPTEAGTGRLSVQEGWGPVNAVPIEQGGIPPHKADFNGVLFLLSQFAVWFQQGGIMNYSALLDYEVGNEVMQNGTKYRCIQPNGPSSTKVAPGTNRAVWKNIDITVPAGAVVPFYNVTLGGTGNRNPIFWGTTQADVGWVLCDGGSDGSGGTTPNLVGKFVKGSLPKDAGATGGFATIEIQDLAVNGTIGGTALTIAQLPAHTHTGSANSAGNHAHTRGTMNITGAFWGENECYGASGAFTRSGAGNANKTEGNNGNQNDLSFDASKTWSGQTSTNGAHTHSLSIGNTGSGQTHTHTLNANVAITGVSNEPPFYTLAYFLRLPE
jgi:hypothetical protein|nr:MAG TPA: LONG TAIL FIBER PROTEIN P37 PROTEIN, FIBER PROTEIN.2A [Caudoviricetes sp.]